MEDNEYFNEETGVRGNRESNSVMLVGYIMIVFFLLVVGVVVWWVLR